MRHIKSFPPCLLFILRFTGTILLGRKWERPASGKRLFVPFRSPDASDEASRALLAALPVPAPLGVLLGPGLPEFSSTKVRAALRSSDDTAASFMLFPEALAWLRIHGPYKPDF